MTVNVKYELVFSSFLNLSQGKGREDSQIIIEIAWHDRAVGRELCLIRHVLAIVTSRNKDSSQNTFNRKVRFGTCRWFSVSDCNRKQNDWLVMATFQEGRANFSLFLRYLGSRLSIFMNSIFSWFAWCWFSLLNKSRIFFLSEYPSFWNRGDCCKSGKTTF